MTGDLNVARTEIDIFNAKGKEKTACYTPEERASFESFISRGYVDTYRKLYPEGRDYTYFSVRRNNKAEDKGWRIDYFIVHESDFSMVEDVKVHKEVDGSDHVPIRILLDLSKIER